MKYLELVEILEQTGLPVAYSHFDDKQKLPFITFEDVGLDSLFADGENYYDITDYDVILHFKYKDPELEQRLKDIFKQNNMTYTATADLWIEDEKRYLKTYEVNI
ncbi:hypothetical protein HYO62_00410 [Aerococcaceae bacterium DSM 111022]|nr:hypothetical protein [Aerococcaceae bacterium DSM 111022]